MVGQSISHYRIVSQLGAGGMGVVYRAEDLRLGRQVALKFVASDLGHDSRAVQRLRSEARAASALNHANICTIYDIDEHEGHPFIVMELMKGRTLREMLAAGPLKVHQLVDIGIEIADALHAAHTEGIIHRDIKPGNVFVTERGHVKVLDFGLAKLTALFEASGTTHEVLERTGEGVTLGTVAYMSPEQATADELDSRTDLFSLGVLLYECATGHQPFTGKTSAVVLAAILNRAPVAPVVLNPELPLRLQEVINNCLEKDRELRYQSAADLRADLKRVRRDIESGQSNAVPAVSRGSGSTREARSRSGSAPLPIGRSWPAWAGVGGAALLALAAIGNYMVWRSEPQQSMESQQIAPAPNPAVSSSLALATASLDARNYRAAAVYAEQVLALDRTNTDAIRIRDEARATLARFDGAIADARQRLAARDLTGASKALDTARSIEAGSPAVTEIALRVAELGREREPVAELTRGTRPLAEPLRRTPALPPPPSPSVGATAPRPSTPVEAPPVMPAPSTPALPATGATTSAPATASAPQPVAEPPKATIPPATAPSLPRDQQPSPAVPTAEQDEAAIRRVIATYSRAIEGKNVALFRSIKPNLSPEEQRRLEDGFRAVTSQRVNLTVVSIDRKGDEASVVLRRQDTIQAGGRQQTTEGQQVMRLARAGRDWTIVDIR